MKGYNNLFGVVNSEGYSDSLKSWQEQADSLNREIKFHEEIVTRDFKRACVFGYFAN